MGKTKIVILTHDSIYSRQIFNKLINSDNIEIVGIVFSNCIMRRGKSGPLEYLYLLKKTGFRYTIYLSYVSFLLPLIKFSCINLKKYAKKHNIYFSESSNVNTKKIELELNRLKPDFILSFNFNQKVLKNTYIIPEIAAINIHPSLLPDYRGVDPLLSARARNETATGVSIHLIGDKMDEGDILKQREIAIGYKQNLIENYTQLFEIGAEMAEDVISNFEDKYKNRQKQNPQEGCYYSWPDSSEYKQYLKTKF
ncbi:MAG TPA: formyltransferase family protein [Victivallales bacterium]|nr:formyltransferase family protein [Victivallales bacterium]